MQLDESAADYQKTALSAFRDVDDALTAYDAEQRRQAHLDAEVIASRHALQIANERYQQGFTDYLSVLTSEQSLLSTEQAQASSQQTIATNLVALFKALGGGWNSADLPLSKWQSSTAPSALASR
jgi:outer membrane protein TolC